MAARRSSDPVAATTTTTTTEALVGARGSRVAIAGLVFSATRIGDATR